MTDWRLLRLAWPPLTVLGLFLGSACGRTDSSTGGEGTETHWLSACAGDDDCEIGQCLCGSCTLPCANLLDCPAPLDRCSTETSDGVSCEQAMCGSSEPGEITAALQKETHVDSCEDGRPMSLRLRKDLFGLEGVTANRDRGFVLWEASGNITSLVGVAPSGHVTQSIWHPSELVPGLSGVTAQPDGSLLTAGTIGGFDGSHAWAGAISPDGSLRWEVDLGRSSAGRMVSLEDGGALVHGLQHEEDVEWAEAQFELFWSRIDRDGNVVWNNRVPLGAAGQDWGPIMEASKLGLLSDQTLRIVENAEEGLTLIQGNLDGAFEQSTLASSINTVIGVAALPDGRLAVAGLAGAYSEIVTTLAFVSRDGSVETERTYARGSGGNPDGLGAFALNAARNELVLAGQSAEGGSWMLATDLQGEPVWELRTAQLSTNIDGDVARLSAGRGPLLVDVAAASDGSLLATGFTNRGLVYLLVGAGDCSE